MEKITCRGVLEEIIDFLIFHFLNLLYKMCLLNIKT